MFEVFTFSPVDDDVEMSSILHIIVSGFSGFDTSIRMWPFGSKDEDLKLIAFIKHIL